MNFLTKVLILLIFITFAVAMTISQEELRKVSDGFAQAFPPKYHSFYEIDEQTVELKDDHSVHFTANEKHGGFAGPEATGRVKKFIARKVGENYEVVEHN